MKTRVLILTGTIFTLAVHAASPEAADHVFGRLLAQPRLGASANGVATALTKHGARLERILDRINIHVLQVPEPALDRVATALMQTGMFTFVEPDYIMRSSGDVIPTDPYFSSQWHLSAIKAPTAWGITTGSPNVIIAVIDSGADWTHPDLAPNLVTGWNFLTGTSITQDNAGHGTAVSGSAAAASNNGEGVAGVSWGARIMPLQVLDATTGASYSSVASAITYAADHGARIISISLCGPSSSSALQSAESYAWNKGSVIFAAAGNASSSALTYPAADPNVVSVSASDQNGTFASFSNYGNWIDISAPGNYILTTVLGGSYGSWYGTSFSTPIAAGVGALILSVKPGLSASNLVSLLEQNADDLGTPGWDQYFGYGQVNAYKAVTAAGTAITDTTPPTVSISSPAGGATVSGSISVQGTATDNIGVTSIQFYVDGQVLNNGSTSPFSFALNTVNYTNGTHTIKVAASDAAGNVGSASISVNTNNQTVTDTVPPTVSIVSPISGTSVKGVTGTLQISASATDNIAVSQVSFYIDKVLKCTDTSSPYTCSWNTKKASTGAHTISVTAWDSSGNSASASETVYK
jgi:subtilisin family serine protease